MEIRRIESDLNAVGRRFMKGDIVVIDEQSDKLVHIYTDEDSLLPEVLGSPLSNVSMRHLSTLSLASVEVNL